MNTNSAVFSHYRSLALQHKGTSSRRESSVAALAAPRLMATSPAGETFGAMYYVKAALAGGICCGITHGAMTVRVSSREQNTIPPYMPYIHTCVLAAQD